MNLLLRLVKRLQKVQRLGKNMKKSPEEILGLRVGKHIIFYRNLNPKEIEVIRILHGRMDLKNRLDE
jgi:toxin ParE1/3/4